MPWRILITPSVEPDFDEFEDKDELSRTLLRWVENGPPGTVQRRAHAAGYEAGVPFYEDRTAGGILIQYFVGTEPDLYVAILRLRPPPPTLPL